MSLSDSLTPEEVGKVAAQAKVKKVILTHLPATITEDDDYQRFIPEVKKYFQGKWLSPKT
jgi:ribonuclease BN (tRNA processing enzyme)